MSSEKTGRVIAIQEAFWNKFVAEHYHRSHVERMEKITNGKLNDVGPERIARMDADGIDFQVLSHSSPGVQMFDRELAIRLARKSNDWLGDMIGKYPTRFGGFAALPTQDPAKAAYELERCVNEMGFVGALINGQTNGHYLDEKSFWPIFSTAQKLDVPIYIHPADAPTPVIETYYKDYPALKGAAWGWAVEIGTQLLRLMCSGVFDQYPRLKIVIGHMGELIPFHLARIDRGLTHGTQPMKRKVRDYMKDNVFITNSGVFENAALLCALETIGIDNILFSVDDPFADNKAGVEFLRSAPLSDGDRQKLAHGNVEKLLKLR